MKKVLLTLLGLIVVLGVLAGAGFVGYRIGYNQAARTVSAAKGTAQLPPQNKGFGPQNTPMLRNFDNGIERGFNRGMGPGGFGMMMGHGGGFGFFSPFFFLVRIAVWVLVIWLIYMVIKSNGWRLTRQPTQNAKVETPVVEPKNDQPE